jgi:2,4-dienoyl-CoA reductase-like NADH-dependent reductase (Old Yellow Enzyme family)
LASGEGGWEVVGPTDQRWDDNHAAPHALTIPEIQEIVQHFADAAKRSLAAGFDVIEIHGAHGYLISSFNSPITNTRTDEYGGSFENRTRLLRELVSATRKVWPEDKPLFVRVSCEDWVEGGWDIEQTVQLAKALEKLGVDLLDCSSGGNVAQQKLNPFTGYQVPFTERVRRDVPGLLTGAVGRITEPKVAEEILATGKSDVVLLGREFLRNPHWPVHAARELGVEVDAPLHYEWTGVVY